MNDVVLVSSCLTLNRTMVLYFYCGCAPKIRTKPVFVLNQNSGHFFSFIYFQLLLSIQLVQHISSDISEVIRVVLDFFIFLRKDFTITKKHKTLTSEQKQKMLLKNI